MIRTLPPSYRATLIDAIANLCDVLLEVDMFAPRTSTRIVAQLRDCKYRANHARTRRDFLDILATIRTHDTELDVRATYRIATSD